MSLSRETFKVCRELFDLCRELGVTPEEFGVAAGRLEWDWRDLDSQLGACSDGGGAWSPSRELGTTPEELAARPQEPSAAVPSGGISKESVGTTFREAQPFASSGLFAHRS